jgi:hypothetical protein
MEPITTSVVAALVAGAVAAAKDVATSAIKDAYQGLKRLLSTRYAGTDDAIAKIEAKPEAAEEVKKLATHLERAGGADDPTLKDAAQALLAAIGELRNTPAAPLFDFDQLEVARNMKLSNIEAMGTVIRARNTKVGGDFEVSGIKQTDPSKKN